MDPLYRHPSVTSDYKLKTIFGKGMSCRVLLEMVLLNEFVSQQFTRDCLVCHLGLLTARRQLKGKGSKRRSST